MARGVRPIVDGTTASLVATTDRVLTVPNLLSALRLAGVPLFLYLLLGPRADGWAVAVLAASGWTDFLDGTIARRYGQVSRVGQLLDPLADRLYTVTTVAALAWRAIVPWWLVAALLARDAGMAALLSLLRRRGHAPPPVHVMGKAATWNLLFAFPLLLLGAGDGPVAGPARTLGWAFAIWGTSLYWWAGRLYADQVRALLRGDRDAAGTEGAVA